MGAPTPEKLELLAPYRENTLSRDGLEPAAKFLLEMASIERLSQRLLRWQSKLSFDARNADAKAQVNAMTAAVECVRNSQMLKQLLSLILQLGNVLNVGSARANAQGFESEVLLKLSETKSSVSDENPTQTSLLHYVAKLAAARHKDIQKQLKHDLRMLEEASSLSSSGIIAEVDSIDKELKLLKDELPFFEAIKSDSDRFFDVMSVHCQGASGKVEHLRKSVDNMLEGLKSLSVYFGEIPSGTAPEELLSRLNTFTVSFCKACRDNEREEHMRQKKEKALKEQKRGWPQGAGEANC